MPAFLDKKKDIVEFEVPIIQAIGCDPFVVTVRDLSQREFRDIYQEHGSAEFRYMDDIIVDWKGLVRDNWNELVRDGRVLKGNPKKEIPFSAAANRYLIDNSWPAEYVDIVYKEILERYHEKEKHDEYIKEELVAYIHATYRTKAPKDCEGCERMMGEDEMCYFTFQWKVPECPFGRFAREPEVVKTYSFCVKAMDSWDVHEEDGFKAPQPISGGGPIVKEVKPKKKNYGISIEKFEWACRLYQIPDEDTMEALQWVGVCVEAANEAPDLELKALRRERFGLRD